MAAILGFARSSLETRGWRGEPPVLFAVWHERDGESAWSLVEPTLPQVLFLSLNSCLRCGQHLVHGANLGMTLYALDDVVRDRGTLDDERTAAARRTLQQVLVFAPMHERIGQSIV